MTAYELLVKMGVKVSEELSEEINEKLKVKSKPRKSYLYKFTGKEPEGKIAPQMQLCIKALPEEPVDMETWANLAEESGLATKQTPERIISYYRKPMIEGGYVETVEAS